MRIGVDIGGTFTDLILVDDRSDRVWISKVRTTPDDLVRAVMEGLDGLLATAGVEGRSVTFFGHGTTVATNAFLQRRGARTGLITTEGFRDILEFRRLARDGPMDAYDLFLDFPQPLVPRVARLEVRERVDFTGAVLKPLDLATVDAAIDELERLDVEAVAIALIHGYANSQHEQRIQERIAERLPHMFVCAAHDVNPEMLEYERTSTTVVNAYLGPPVATYLMRLNESVLGRDLPEVHLLQSNGGLIGATSAADLPVTLLESGPAGGLSACVRIGRDMGEPNLVMLDVGGTSTDIAVIADHTPRLLTQSQIDGYAIRSPMSDIRSIGAGGGSVIRVTRGGGVTVGPDSVGAVPGPVCYDSGGTEPAMTDAALVLGLLGDDSLLGGGMTVSRPAAEAALGALASRLSMSVNELAAGVFKIMNANIAASIRLALVERGLDPRDFAIIALGGAGPVHAAAVANEIGIPRVVIPPYPGITSALGAATTDLIHHYAAAVMETIEAINSNRLELSFVNMEKRGQDALATEGVAMEDIELRRSCDMRYQGQYHETSITLTGQVTSSSLRKTAEAFHGRHRALYGFNQPDDPVMITNVRVQAIGAVRSEHAPISGAGSSSIDGQESARSREVSVEDSAGAPWPVFQRAQLAPDFRVEGPCIIEQTDTTTVVLSGQRIRRTGAGFLLIDEVTGNE